MKRKLMCLVLAAMMLVCTGCLNPSALDQYSYVMSIGVDMGKQMRFNVTFLVQKEDESAEGKTSGGAIYLTAEGDTLLEALETCHKGVPTTLSFSRINSINFSSEVAEAGLIEEFMSFSLDSLSMRQSVRLLITQGKAEDFLKGMTMGGKENIAKIQMSLKSFYEMSGIFSLTNFALLIEAIDSRRLDVTLSLCGVDESVQPPQQQSGNSQGTGDGSGSDAGTGGGGTNQNAAQGGASGAEDKKDTTAGVFRSGGMKAYVSGSALFDGWKMVGTLNAPDTQLMLIARGEFKQGKITFKGIGDGILEGRFELIESPKIKTNTQDGLFAEFDISLRCSIITDTAEVTRSMSGEAIEQAMAAQLEEGLERVFLGCRSLNSDAFHLGRVFSKNFILISEWESFDWKSRYKDVNASFNVKVKLDGRYSPGLWE